jgi:hypothetical protein
MGTQTNILPFNPVVQPTAVTNQFPAIFDDLNYSVDGPAGFGAAVHATSVIAFRDN